MCSKENFKANIICFKTDLTMKKFKCPFATAVKGKLLPFMKKKIYVTYVKVMLMFKKKG